MTTPKRRTYRPIDPQPEASQALVVLGLTTLALVLGAVILAVIL